MDNMTVVSLSSGILLFDLRSGERSNCRSSSSSGFMDPYQRCALLFAMYQTSLECSGDGIGMLDLGVESISFHPNQEVLCFCANRVGTRAPDVKLQWFCTELQPESNGPIPGP